MKPFFQLLSFVALLLFVTSCNRPSAKDVAAREKFVADSIASVQKMRLDSVAKATELATLSKVNNKAALQKTLAETIQKKELWQTDAADALEDISNANKEIERINGLWTAKANRDMMVREQETKIRKAKERIDQLNEFVTDADQKIVTLQSELKQYE